MRHGKIIRACDTNHLHLAQMGCRQRAYTIVPINSCGRNVCLQELPNRRRQQRVRPFGFRSSAINNAQNLIGADPPNTKPRRSIVERQPTTGDEALPDDRRTPFAFNEHAACCRRRGRGARGYHQKRDRQKELMITHLPQIQLSDYAYKLGWSADPFSSAPVNKRGTRPPRYVFSASRNS
jgi:hypothetical protein